jgi:hypothetical protein
MQTVINFGLQQSVEQVMLFVAIRPTRYVIRLSTRLYYNFTVIVFDYFDLIKPFPVYEIFAISVYTNR